MQTLENVKEHVDWVNEHNIRLHCKYMYPNNCTYSFKIFWEWYFYYFRKFESKQRTVKALSISPTDQSMQEYTLPPILFFLNPLQGRVLTVHSLLLLHVFQERISESKEHFSACACCKTPKWFVQKTHNFFSF